jgi:hypothetical protein
MKQAVINHKKLFLVLCVAVSAVIAVVIVVTTVILPPINAHANFVRIIGFTPPVQEAEFQMLYGYYSNGKSKVPDYAAKYVIDTGKLDDVTQTIRDITRV